MSKLFDQPIKDAHIILEAADDGTLDVRVSYPASKLEAPLASLLQKIAAKIPFVKNYAGSVPGAVSAAFARFGVKSSAPIVDAEAAAPAAGPAQAPAPQPEPAAQPVAAHEAQPVEPVHQA